MGRPDLEQVIRWAAALLLCGRCSSGVLAADESPGQPAPDGAKLVQVGSIPLEGVEGRLDHLAWDPKSRRLFVAALENHTVEVVDLAERRRIREITGINEPQGLAFLPDTRRLLVCSRGDGTCRSFDADTFQEGPWIDLGRNADNLRVNPISKVLYVGSGGEPGHGFLSAVELASLLPANRGGQPAPPHSPADFLLDRPRQADPKFEMQLPAHPESFQLDLANRRIFVNVPDEHKVFVLSVTPNGFATTAAWPVTVGEKNFPMTFDAPSARLFIASREPARLAVYDVHTGSLLAQAPCVGDADDMFYDAESSRLYIVGGEGFVDLFHVPKTGARPTLLSQVPTAARARTGLFVRESQTLVVAAPHTTNGPAALLLFQAAASPRLNQAQVIGTHNSYHQRGHESLLALIGRKDPALAKGLDYEHPPLPEQLSRGIRQIELDCFADPQGGLFAHPRGPKAAEAAGLPAVPSRDPDGQLGRPGFKVMHVQDIDYFSSVLTLVQGLQQVQSWSAQHPGHFPIFILLELKDDLPSPELTRPVPIGERELAALEAEILSVFRRDQILAPDDVRGKEASLPDALRKHGWPTLAAASGKVMFGLDDGGTIRDLYLAGHPALEGRLLFANVPPENPAAAWMEENDPVAGFDKIQAWVKAGFLVRTRADADTLDARRNDTQRRDHALASGAQFISTDYPEPDLALSPYCVRFEHGVHVRSNPVSGDPLLRGVDLEQLR